MKTKFFMLLAAVLLSASAFAQSENTGTLKGDVNGDGVVDVADINAIIQIMKNGGGTGEETKYYWYAGQVQPQDMSSNPTIDDTNFTVNKWHTLGTATTIAKTITGGTSGNDWYVAVPTSINLKPTATDLTTPDTSWDNLGTITISGISYTVWRTNGTGSRSAVYMAGTGEETKYYWYVGTTVPTDPTNTAQNTGNNEWTSIGTNLPTSDIKVNKVDTSYNFSTWYIAAPSDANFTLYNGTNVASDEAGWKKSTFNVGSVQYTLWTCKATSYQAVGYLHK